VLRYRTPESQLRVKMWLFPVLSILTTAGILAVLVQMYTQKTARSELLLSLLSWGVVLTLYLVHKWFLGRGAVAPEEAH